MSYDIELIQVSAPSNTSFPIEEAKAQTLLKSRIKFDDVKAVREKLLKIEGCRAGPDDSVDFLGHGLSYARLFVKDEMIHIENNCGAKELLKIYGELLKACPKLLIYDLQSKQLHNADSYKQWWSRPL